MGLHVIGNQLYVREITEPIRLMGVSVQDPLWQRIAPGPRLLDHGPLSMELAKTWGINAVRIPFHPATIRAAGEGDWPRGLEAACSELDWIFLAAQGLGLRVLIDFHSIGFPASQTTFEFDEAPYENIYETDQYEIETFWRTMSMRYGDHPCLAGFEIFNEASRETAFGTQEDWNLHATWSESLLQNAIRPYAPSTLAIIGGLHFGYDLEGALIRPVRDANVAYSSHPYPHHSQAKCWNQAFGEIAKRHVVLLTEVGFATEGYFSREHHRGYRSWELEIQKFADSRNLSVFAWNFSHSWEPALLTEDFAPTEAGAFFMNWFKAQSRLQPASPKAPSAILSNPSFA